MAHGRAYHNLTLLPDGTVLASGGGSRSDGVDIEQLRPAGRDLEPGHGDVDGGRLAPERPPLPLDRAAAAGRPRADGGRRRWSAAATDIKNGEIYSPPYLFKGPRPTITTAPASMAYGASFDVTTPNAAADRPGLADPLPSVTHAIDMNQRFQCLNFTAGAGKVTVHAPANANLAPPGRLPALPRRHERRAVGGPVHPAEPGAAVGRHDAADGVPDRARRRLGSRWHASTSRRTPPTTTSVSGRPVQARRSRPRRRGRVGAVRGLLGHDDCAERDAHADRGRARPVGQRGDLGARAGDGLEQRPTARPRRGLRLRRGSGSAVTDQSGNGNNGTLTNATWAGASAGRYGNALSFNGTNASVTHPRLDLARPDDRDDDRGLGATRRCSATQWRTRGAEGAARLLRLRALREHGQRQAQRQRDDRRHRPRGPGYGALPLTRGRIWRRPTTGNVLALYVNGVQSATARRGSSSPSPRTRSSSAATRSGVSGSAG